MAGRTVRISTTTAAGDTHTDEVAFAPGDDVSRQIKSWLDWAMINATDEFEIHISPDRA